jgi:hypothetical protein
LPIHFKAKEEEVPHALHSGKRGKESKDENVNVERELNTELPGDEEEEVNINVLNEEPTGQ